MLTVNEVRALPPGKAISDGGTRGLGALWFKASRSGAISAVFRYSVDRKVTDLTLGPFDVTGKAGITLAQARARAAELSRMIQDGIADPKAHLEREAKAKVDAEDARLKAQEAARAAEERQARDHDAHSLERLCGAYTAYLQERGKACAKDVESIFRVHVSGANPDLAGKVAREVTRSELAGMIRKVAESGKARTAGILRAYLNAAYSLALGAEGNIDAPAELIAFAIEVNPVAGIKSIPVQAGERTLTREELRVYLHKLGDGLSDQALRLALYAGGQRMEQLLRARVSDFDPTTGILRLSDPKGRRIQPRPHHLPLGPVAKELVKALTDRARELQPDEADPALFVTARGILGRTLVSHRLSDIAQEMGGATFTLRDLRRTCETDMARMGFSSDLRAQLLSHGLSGVQAKHYDRHGYMDEKQAALIRWERHLDDVRQGREVGNVVPMRRRKRA